MTEHTDAGGEPGALAEALDAVAQAAHEAAGVQRRVAADARRTAGTVRAAPGTPVGPERIRGLLDALDATTRRLGRAAGDLRRTWAASLAAEGMTRRRIASHLGVSHQRVSVLLSRRGTAAPADPGTTPQPVPATGG